MKRKSAGQSTLEYVIILSVVVGAIILVGNTLKNRLSKTGGSYDQLTDKMRDAATKVNFD